MLPWERDNAHAGMPGHAWQPEKGQAAGPCSKPVYFPSPWSQARAGCTSTCSGFVQRFPRTP